jgi:predicted Zn-dependent protease
MVAALAGGLAGCGAQSGDEPSTAEADSLSAVEAGLIAPLQDRFSKWPSVVAVCVSPAIGDPASEFETAKAQLIKAVQTGWQRHANLRFDFSCPSNAAQKIVVTLKAQNDLNVGGDCDGFGAATTRKINISYCAPSLPNADCSQVPKDGFVYNIDRMEPLRALALHEFGHALGFVHEHKRKDTPQDVEVWCDAAKPESRVKDDVNNGYEPGGGQLLTSSYDYDSIMSYCRDVDRNREGDGPVDHVADRLSEGDKWGVQALYGAPAPYPMWHDALYRSSDDAAVLLYSVKRGRACHVTWPQFVDIGKPFVTVVSPSQGQQLRAVLDGGVCTKEALGALPDGLYRQYDDSAVFKLNGQTACHVTWTQFSRMLIPMPQLLTAADGQRLREAYFAGSVCTDAQVGL